MIANAGHFPHKDHPQRFVKIVDEFIRPTPAATYHRGRWRTLLRNGPRVAGAGRRRPGHQAEIA